MYDVYTEVSQYMDWIEKKILSNGGLAACDLTFSAPPSIDDGESLACSIKGCGRFFSKDIRIQYSIDLAISGFLAP